VQELADVVSKRLHEQHKSKQHLQPITSFWKNYERSTPTVVCNETENTTPPLNFGVTLTETDLNDSFDEQALLKRIPKAHQKNAGSLLKSFDERPNEITWDSSGHIYLDEKVLPNANIFQLFPLLFKKKVVKKPNGLLDLVKKIESMNLSHLISLQLHTNQHNLPKKLGVSAQPSKWWFLGE